MMIMIDEMMYSNILKNVYIVIVKIECCIFDKPVHFWAKMCPLNFSLCPVNFFSKRIRFLPPLHFLYSFFKFAEKSSWNIEKGQ